MHDPVVDREEVGRPSERSFGITFAVVFVLVGLWPLLHGGLPRIWSLGLAGLFLVAAAARPALLAPLNALWFRFGQALHRIVSPLVLGFLFFAAITPMAAVLRLLGHSLLNRKYDPDAATYWIPRRPPGPVPETIRNQF